MDHNFFHLLREVIKQNVYSIVVTIIATDEPLRKFLGGKALFKDNKMINWYNLNQDLIESLNGLDFSTRLDQAKVIRQCVNIKSSGPSWVDLYIESVIPSQELIIFGGGHISLPLVQLGKMIGFNVTVVDDRPLFANENRFPQADKVLCLPFPRAVDEIFVDHNTFVVIVTRGHQHDQTCLRGVINKSPAYLGMIGSRSRVKKVMNDLLDNGYSREAVEAVYAPIGLDIHANTPEEIAVSIIAQIISLRGKSTLFDRTILNPLIMPEFQGIKKALVTIVRKKGSVPRGAGTKMLVLEDGTCYGTIGGGCIEADVRATALDVLNEGTPLLLHVDLTNDIAEEEGMACGGTADVFIDPVCNITSCQ